MLEFSNSTSRFASSRAATVNEHFKKTGPRLLCVDGRDHALRAIKVARFVENFWPIHARRVDADFVRSRIQQGPQVFGCFHATADRERNEHLRRNTFNQIVEQPASFNARGNVKKAKLVRALIVVALCYFNRIARIAQSDEVNAFDDASVFDIEARNDAFTEHV